MPDGVKNTLCSSLPAFPAPPSFLMTALTPSPLIIFKYLGGENVSIMLYQVAGNDSPGEEHIGILSKSTYYLPRKLKCLCVFPCKNVQDFPDKGVNRS